MTLGLERLKEQRTQIQVEGKLQSENIDCLYSPKRIRFSKSERLLIEREWKKEVKKKPTIFDGRLFHLKRQDFNHAMLVLDTCISSFKEWIGTKNNGFKEAFGQNRTIKPLSVGSMIVTADNKWIIGRRLKNYGFKGRYAVLGGYMDPDKDIVNSKPDPFFAIKREIEEETGVDRNRDIQNVICLGLNNIDQPYLAFSTQLKISYNEILSNVPKERELGKLESHGYSKQSIDNFVISNYKELTPHTLANMLMSHKLLTVP